MENDKQLTLAPGFWDDNARATSILKEIKVNKFWVDLYEQVQTAIEDSAVLNDFQKEGEASEQEVQEAYEKALNALDELEFKSTLNQPEDEMPAVLTINSGAGGTESQDWAEMLLRMYRMYGEKQGWKVSEIDVQYGDGAGIKSATLEFDGEFAYGLLKAESGVHRLVRISPFDANARRHTVFRLRICLPAGRRHHRNCGQPGRSGMGILPFRWQGRTKRKQGGNRRTFKAYPFRHHHRMPAGPDTRGEPRKGPHHVKIPPVRRRDTQTRRTEECGQRQQTQD